MDIQDNELEMQFKKLQEKALDIGLDVKSDIASLEPVVHRFFDNHIGHPDFGAVSDRFFSRIGGAWKWLLENNNYKDAEIALQEAVNIARNWEQCNNPHLVHKGTAFYFWGGTAILQGNFRKGFLLLHASLDEDKRKHYRQDEDPNTPARMFVMLDARIPDQFFRDLVRVGTDELEKRLAKYRATANSTLQFSDLQNSYMTQHSIREIVFVFTMTIFEVINIRDTFNQARAGDNFGAQIAANYLFDLCQVIEESIRNKNRSSGEFKAQATFLSNQYSWPDDDKIWVLVRQTPLADINQQQMVDFDLTVRRLLDNAVTAGGRTPISEIERDLWLSYVVRNSVAHNLSSKRVLQERFESIYQSILNTLFATIEKLYV